MADRPRPSLTMLSFSFASGRTSAGRLQRRQRPRDHLQHLPPSAALCILPPSVSWPLWVCSQAVDPAVRLPAAGIATASAVCVPPSRNAGLCGPQPSPRTNVNRLFSTEQGACARHFTSCWFMHSTTLFFSSSSMPLS